MQSTSLLAPPTAVERTTTSDGSLVRRAAIAAAIFYSTMLLVLFAVAPELRTDTVAWFLWILIVTGAAATYVAGLRLQRRSGDQSKEMPA